MALQRRRDVLLHTGHFWQACRIVGLTPGDLRQCTTEAQFLGCLAHRYHARVWTCHPDVVSGAPAQRTYGRVLRANIWLKRHGWRRLCRDRTPSIPEVPWPWAAGWEPMQYP